MIPKRTPRDYPNLLTCYNKGNLTEELDKENIENMEIENSEETTVESLLPLATASQQPYVSELLSFTLDRLHKVQILLVLCFVYVLF